LGRPVGTQIGFDARSTSRSINEGEPVVLGQSNTPIAADYRKIAADLLAGDVTLTVETTKPKKSGRFGLFAKS
jgi:MinD-like ATPase involved in chromosome partitioning or flagellar assembly